MAWRLTCPVDGKVATQDQAIARLAERQHGVVSIRQLHAIGISEDAVHGRARTGRLHRIHRGVYAVGHLALSNEARWMAAILACGRTAVAGSSRRGGVGDDELATVLAGDTTRTVLDHWGAALSHRSAAVLWGLLRPIEGPIDITVPGYGGRARRRGIRLHRSWLLVPAAVALRSGIPVTTPARTIADLRRVVSSKGKQRLISPKELRRAIRQADVLGLPIGPEADWDRTRSDLERAFLRLCRDHRLPAPEVNVRIGRYLVDFLWRDRRLIVETDGYRYHRGHAAFEDDRSRDLALQGLGYAVVRLSARQLSEEPEQIVGVLRARLALFPSDTPETRHAAP